MGDIWKSGSKMQRSVRKFYIQIICVIEYLLLVKIMLFIPNIYHTERPVQYEYFSDQVDFPISTSAIFKQ